MQARASKPWQAKFHRSREGRTNTHASYKHPRDVQCSPSNPRLLLPPSPTPSRWLVERATKPPTHTRTCLLLQSLLPGQPRGGGLGVLPQLVEADGQQPHPLLAAEALPQRPHRLHALLRRQLQGRIPAVVLCVAARWDAGRVGSHSRNGTFLPPKKKLRRTSTHERSQQLCLPVPSCEPPVDRARPHSTPSRRWEHRDPLQPPPPAAHPPTQFTCSCCCCWRLPSLGPLPSLPPPLAPLLALLPLLPLCLVPAMLSRSTPTKTVANGEGSLAGAHSPRCALPTALQSAHWAAPMATTSAWPDGHDGPVSVWKSLLVSRWGPLVYPRRRRCSQLAALGERHCNGHTLGEHTTVT